MECEAVDGRLLDLVEGELEPTDAQSIRAHVETCAECGRALARLEGGRAIARKMEIVEPRAGSLDAVRAAARARAAEVVRESAPSPRAAAVEDVPRARPRERESEPERAWWGELFRWLGSMAMGPQVAMATLLVLMVGLGLWSIPSLRGRGAPIGTAVLPDTAGEVGPSTGGLEPAEPLAFDFDPRTRRLEPIGDEQATREGGSIPAARPAPVADRGGPRVTVPIEPARERAPRREQAPEGADDEGDEEERALALAEVEAELGPGDSLGGSHEEPTPAAQAQSRAAASATASVERQSPVAALPQPHQSAERAPIASSTPRYQYQQPSQDDGVARPQPDGDTLVATALHRQARAAAARGAHADCVRQYEMLAARHPSYGESGRALVELAECQRRLGQLTAAARTLERAQQHASVRADATRELARVRMAERAAEVELDQPAAEAAGRAPSTASE